MGSFHVTNTSTLDPGGGNYGGGLDLPGRRLGSGARAGIDSIGARHVERLRSRLLGLEVRGTCLGRLEELHLRRRALLGGRQRSSATSRRASSWEVFSR